METQRGRKPMYDWRIKELYIQSLKQGAPIGGRKIWRTLVAEARVMTMRNVLIRLAKIKKNEI